MKFRMASLELKFKKDEDVIQFDDITYFYGKMGAGKTSIARLIDYCLGSGLDLSPALQSEFVSAKLNVVIDSNKLSIERVRESDKVVAFWVSGNDRYEAVLPAKKAAGEIIPGTGIENLSDLIFYLAGITPPKVRRSKTKEDSDLERLSIRNLLWFCYLDQDSMDSSFFNLDLDTAFYNRNKSKDVLRYVVGFHQEQVAELETELQFVHEQRMAIQAGAESLKSALEGEGIADRKEIESRVNALQQELSTVLEVIKSSRERNKQNIPHPVDQLRQVARQMLSELQAVEDAIFTIENSLGGDRRHVNELTMLKVKYKRITAAKNILSGVEFNSCPRCAQPLPHRNSSECPVCGQLEPEEPQYEIKKEIIDVDTTNRISELSDLIERQSAQLKKLRNRYQELTGEKQKIDQLINEATSNYDSSYLSSTLEFERRKAEIEQTIYKLNDYARLTNKVDDLYKKVSEFEAREIELRRSLKEARTAAEGDTSNLTELENLFLDCLLRARLSGFTSEDHVVIKSPHFLPEVISPTVGDLSVTSFSNLSSGGKKSIFKACFAIAFHRLAVKINAVLPSFLIIDSPMKNISERENREQFEGFHQMMYELAETELSGTQIIMIDKEYCAPPENSKLNISVRHMTPEDDENPPLVRYYRGH